MYQCRMGEDFISGPKEPVLPTCNLCMYTTCDHFGGGFFYLFNLFIYL